MLESERWLTIISSILGIIYSSKLKVVLIRNSNWRLEHQPVVDIAREMRSAPLRPVSNIGQHRTEKIVPLSLSDFNTWCPSLEECTLR